MIIMDSIIVMITIIITITTYTTTIIISTKLVNSKRVFLLPSSFCGQSFLIPEQTSTRYSNEQIKKKNKKNLENKKTQLKPCREEPESQNTNKSFNGRN